MIYDLIRMLERRVRASEVSKAELLAALAYAHHGESVPLRAAKEQGAAIETIGGSAIDLRDKVKDCL